MTSKTYPLPDPTAIAAKVAALGGPVIDPTQTTGTATAEGVTLLWSVTDGEIAITIEKKPFWMQEGWIWNHVDQVFA